MVKLGIFYLVKKATQFLLGQVGDLKISEYLPSPCISPECLLSPPHYCCARNFSNYFPYQEAEGEIAVGTTLVADSVFDIDILCMDFPN